MNKELMQLMFNNGFGGGYIYKLQSKIGNIIVSGRYTGLKIEDNGDVFLYGKHNQTVLIYSKGEFLFSILEKVKINNTLQNKPHFRIIKNEIGKYEVFECLQNMKTDGFVKHEKQISQSGKPIIQVFKFNTREEAQGVVDTWNKKIK